MPFLRRSKRIFARFDGTRDCADCVHISYPATGFHGTCHHGIFRSSPRTNSTILVATSIVKINPSKSLNINIAQPRKKY